MHQGSQRSKMAGMMTRTTGLSLLTALLALTLLPGGTVVAGSSPRFLTLPFAQTSGMRIEDGWLRGAGDVHGGLDYINGKVGRPSTWDTFPVIAAAGGRACAARSRVAGCGADGINNGIGNRVVIRHRREGRIWYSYYGHLRNFAPEIAVGTNTYVTRVRRGQFLGMAGRSGNPNTATHLHFEIDNVNGNPVDPYDVYGYRGAYPNPRGTNGRDCGNDHFWQRCPPVAPDVTSGIPDAISAERTGRITVGRRRGARPTE